MDEVCPMDMRYLLCFDEHGCNYISGGHKNDVRRLVGKRIIKKDYVTDREEKKFASTWAIATTSDNKFKGVNCKQQEIFSAGGMRGSKCMKFPGFSKEELPNPLLIIEIRGLGLAQDLNPNSDTVGCVIF